MKTQTTKTNIYTITRVFDKIEKEYNVKLNKEQKSYLKDEWKLLRVCDKNVKGWFQYDVTMEFFKENKETFFGLGAKVETTEVKIEEIATSNVEVTETESFTTPDLKLELNDAINGVCEYLEWHKKYEHFQTETFTPLYLYYSKERIFISLYEKQFETCREITEQDWINYDDDIIKFKANLKSEITMELLNNIEVE